MSQAESVPRTVYVIDDDPDLRDTIGATLVKSWSDWPLRDQPRTGQRDFIWRLSGSSSEVRPSDIAICDLYPYGFWSNAPGRLPKRVAQLPDDPRNLVIATQHIIEGYLAPMKTYGLQVLVFSYIPPFLAEHDFRDEADELRRRLQRHDLVLIEKADRSAHPRNLCDVVTHVQALLSKDITDHDPPARDC